MFNKERNDLTNDEELMKVVESIFIWGTIIFTAVMLFIGIREMISKARDVGLRQTIQYAIRIALFLAVLPLLALHH